MELGKETKKSNNLLSLCKLEEDCHAGLFCTICCVRTCARVALAFVFTLSLALFVLFLCFRRRTSSIASVFSITSLVALLGFSFVCSIDSSLEDISLFWQMSPSNTKEDLVKQFHKIHLKSMEHCHGLRQQTSVKMAQFIQELQQLDLDREKSTKKATEKIKLMNAKEKDILAQIKTERKAAQDKIEREKEKQLKEQAELERLEAAKAIELQNKEADRLQKEAAATAAEKERQSKIQDSEVKLANKAAVKEDQSLYGAICQRYLLHYEVEWPCRIVNGLMLHRVLGV